MNRFSYIKGKIKYAIDNHLRLFIIGLLIIVFFILEIIFHGDFTFHKKIEYNISEINFENTTNFFTLDLDRTRIDRIEIISNSSLPATTMILDFYSSKNLSIHKTSKTLQIFPNSKIKVISPTIFPIDSISFQFESSKVEPNNFESIYTLGKYGIIISSRLRFSLFLILLLYTVLLIKKSTSFDNLLDKKQSFCFIKKSLNNFPIKTVFGFSVLFFLLFPEKLPGAINTFILMSFLWGIGYIANTSFFKKELFATPYNVFNIFSGLIFLSFYVFIRSFLNSFLQQGILIYSLEIAAILLCLILINRKNLKEKLIQNEPNELTNFFINILIISILISYIELPREFPLSSDPAIHAYFLNISSRLNDLAMYDKSLLGTTSMSYPGGFVIQSFAISLLSGLSSIEVITIQPLLFLLLTVSMISDFAFQQASQKKSLTENSYHFVSLLLISISFLAYSYQPSRLYLEGTARLASIGWVGVVFVLIFQFSKKIIFKKILMTRDFIQFFFYIFACNVLIALLNPLQIIPLFFLEILLFIVLFLLTEQRKKYIFSSIFCIPIFVFVFLDPYFYGMLLPIANHQSISNSDGGVLHTINNPGFFELFKDNLIFIKNHPRHFFNELVSINFVDIRLVYIFILATIVPLLIYFLRKDKMKNKLKVILLFATIPFSTLFIKPAINYLIQKNFDAHYLIFPYVDSTIEQIAIIFYLLGFAFCIFEIINLIQEKNLGFFFLIFVFSISLFKLAAPAIEIQRRNNIGSSVGNFHEADSRLIAVIEENYRKNQSAGKTTFLTFPVILFNTEYENWLFPYNGANLLAYSDVYPLYFFYGFGHEEGTYDYYVNNIYNSFNIKWLLERNIKYFFLPTGSLELNYVKNIVNGSKNIIQYDNAYFVEISF